MSLRIGHIASNDFLMSLICSDVMDQSAAIYTISSHATVTHARAIVVLQQLASFGGVEPTSLCSTLQQRFEIFRAVKVGPGRLGQKGAPVAALFRRPQNRIKIAADFAGIAVPAQWFERNIQLRGPAAARDLRRRGQSQIDSLVMLPLADDPDLKSLIVRRHLK